MPGYYPVSLIAVAIRLGIHRLLRWRILHSGEVLALGLFEGAILFHALDESPAVGAGCFLGFGSRVVIEHMKAPDPINVACSLLGLALGLLLSNVISSLWEDNTRTQEKERSSPRRSRSHRRHRSSNTRMLMIEGAPTPDSLSKQLSRRTNFHIPDEPMQSPWEGLQSPLGPGLGLEEEVMELRRRASSAAGQTRKLQEEKKWALSQGNPARAFQLGWDIKRFQALSDLLNREAAEKIALARTQSLLAKGGDVNLFGFSSADAINLTDRRITSARAVGDSYLRISLAGMNNLSIAQHHRSNSASGATIRPLLETYLRGRHHSVIQDPSDRDHLIVSVDTHHGSSSISTRSAPVSDEWSRALD
ncbi:hypothetical protein FRB93_011419 [Tulasnella sp. JGI-2019a]|nr:hypothetical protein FRB93_011419 [Tulasnella sp. JGI-2019a]